tara:strand:+ start:304 stop:531 length:228 start_codon:yes stop_codon:yes gene_type:complete
MVPTLNNQDERSKKLNSAKDKALILIRNGDKKLAKISFLNDCKIYNLYPNLDFISKSIKYIKDDDFNERVLNDYC